MNTQHWRIQLFGVLTLVSGNETITRFRTQATGSLLAYLAYYKGRPHPREVLIEQFWPEADEKSGRVRLSNALYALRCQLGKPGVGTSVFIADNFTVALNPVLFETDAAAFQNTLKRARRAASLEDRRDLLEQALGIYGGDLLVGRYEPWIVPEQNRLREMFDQAKDELAALKNVRIPEPGMVSTQLETTAMDAPVEMEDAILPIAFTKFFGREPELAQLTELLKPSASPTLLTITGIGGIGKTRLAQEVARRMQDEFQKRTWFVPLADLHDAERLLGAIGESLRLPKDPATDVLNQVCTFLSAGPSLLILDNMEQFASDGRAALILQSLRERVPALVCVATSRHVLGIAGERAMPVGPLTETEDEACIQLFEDRARAVRPSFRISSDSYPNIHQLCLVLDGIPLAIELAAARIAVLTPVQMLAQMESRFSILRSRRHDVPERHRSLWAAIDSSYQLLPEDLKRFFSRLSVFRGGWTLDAVQAICVDEDTDPDEVPFMALEFMSELHESSLVSPVVDDTGSARYRMLDTLRDYAADQLKHSGSEEAVRQRHAKYFASFASEAESHLATGEAGQRWLNDLERDHANLCLALDTAPPLIRLQTANALRRFWVIKGHVIEGRRYLESALMACANVEAVPPSELAIAQSAMGILAMTAKALQEARKHFAFALQYYEAAGETQHVAQTLNNIANVETLAQDFAGARASYEQSLSLYRVLGDRLGESVVKANLGIILVYLKEYKAARQILEECAVDQKAANDYFTLLRTLQNLTEAGLGEGDIFFAASTLRESLVIRRISGDQSVFDDVLITASMIFGRRDQMQESCVIWAAAQSIRSLAGTAPSPANVDDEMAWLDHMQSLLSPDVFEEMQRKGSAMNFEQAISYVERLL